MAESLVLKGNKYSMKIVAEKKTEGRTSRGDHYSSDQEYAICYWKGGGEIKDKTARKSRLFEIKSREYNESRTAFPPLAEAIIRFGFRRFSWSYDEIEWRPVIKDEKRLTDLVLKQIFSEIEKAEAADRKKYPLPKVTPEPLDVRDMVEMGLIEEDRRFRLGITYDHNETASFSTRLSLPRNSLLLMKDMIKMCRAVNNDSRDKAEDNITEPIDVELLTIETSNPGLDECVSEVSGKAMTLRNDLPGNRLEIGFSIPSLCAKQALPETRDSIEDAKLVFEFHEGIIRRIIDITRRNRDKHLGLHQEQLVLPCMPAGDPF
jgi:hypothetical protein